MIAAAALFSILAGLGVVPWSVCLAVVIAVALYTADRFRAHRTGHHEGS
ncbi:hypothetical protein [Streptomyces sp. SID3343]|nr:hypothetical protein [Streptomyces sp. SID3343]MYW00895.1 hypothetical protein [Streptomyces sp. SID3343]